MPAIRFWALFRAIGQLEAAQDLRALAVAINAQDGRLARDYAGELEARATGRADGQGAGMPTAALSGPNVTVDESGALRARHARLAAQVEEQRAAWKQGGWPAVTAVLVKQRETNRMLG